MKNNNADELAANFLLSTHVENGSYLERHYVSDEQGRPASGSIYYYVSPNEITKFHSIDCDEYWIYVSGSPLEVCSIGMDGRISFNMLGTAEGCEPLIYFKSGVRFASRHAKREREGTFLVCITVPRFDPAGFTLCEKEEILKEFPELEPFFIHP